MKHAIVPFLILIIIFQGIAFISVNSMLTRANAAADDAIKGWKETIAALNENTHKFKEFQDFCKPYLQGQHP